MGGGGTVAAAARQAGWEAKDQSREVLNAIRYMVRSGCEWRMIPIHFPPWQTVYWWFRRFVRMLLFRTIHHIAVMTDRERAGREASPSGGIIDSQTVKAPDQAVVVAMMRPRKPWDASGISRSITMAGC